MHFFIDPAQLPPQDPSQAYGPLVTNPASEFRLTSQFTLTAANPAFACQEGQLLVVEANTPGQVTLILKPIGGLDVGLSAVRYYVYRGVQKASFVQGTTLRPRTPATDNSAALNLFWKSFDAAKKAQKQPALADPLPASLVVAKSVANQPIEAYFTGHPDQLPLVVKEGNSLGNFALGTIGFEIITDTYGLTLDLDYCRRASYSVKQTDLNTLTGLAQTAARDAILSFIDPAAFYGLHAEVGVRFGTATQPLTGTALLAGGVQQFATHNRAYLDIRNECGRSYNFSNSYHDANNHDLGIGGSFTTYATAGWPLHYVDLSASSGTTVPLQLRLDSNDSPQLFCEAGRYGGPGQPLGPCFAPPADLAELSDKWTHLLPFYLPDATATYLKLHYYRPALLANPPAGVLVRRHRLDNLFDLSHLPAAPTVSASVQHAYAPEPVLVTGQLAASTATYAYVASSGVYASADQAVYYLREQQGPPNPARTSFYPPNASGTTSTGLFNDVRAGFLRTQVALSATPVTAAGMPLVQVANIYAYSGTPNYRESLTLLSLTTSELQALAAATPSSSLLHPRYLVFTEATPAGGLPDDTGANCIKYQVRVQGLNNAGQATLATPTPEVYVYAPKDGFLLTSPGLSSQLITKSPVAYMRDFEEALGENPFQKRSKLTLEDAYINLCEPIKKLVAGFLTDVTAIKGTDPTLYKQEYEQLKVLVTAAGQALFQAGVAYIKAGLGHTGAPNPDDRPMYWGRIKLAVILKKHRLFANADNLEVDSNDKSNGRVKPPSDLAKLIQILEETSRNYTGVSFAAAGADVKKILVTGYDPFQLTDNPYQINPSDIIAGALHGTQTHDPVTKQVTGFIQVMIFPVRYRDFDSSLVANTGQGEGVAEKYITPFVNNVDMIVTISQGGRGKDYRKTPDYYDIEHYATDTRGGFEDNLNESRPKYDPVLRAMPLLPIVTDSPDPTKNNLDNMEWLATTLPPNMYKSPANLHDTYAIVKDKDGKPLEVEDSPLPTDFKYGTTQNEARGILLSPKKQMYVASGGDYLSNEIFYRVARMRQQNRPSLATGHLHTPIVGSSPAKSGLDTIDPKVSADGSVVDFKKMREVIAKVRIIFDNGLAKTP